MDSSSRDRVLKLLNQIILRMKYASSDEFQFHWNHNHLSVVHHYLSTLHFPCDFQLPIVYANLSHDPLWYSLPGNCTKYAHIVASFAQELHLFFHVPSPHQLLHGDHNLKENELLAAFLDFLLRLLCHDTDFTDLLKDQIHVFQKGLRFLVTVVGDTVLVDDEDEAVRNLLEEFKAVVNEAGRLVHSLFFSVDPVSAAMEEELGVVLKGIGLLSDNVVKFLDVLPSICKAYVTPTTFSADSLVIVDSLFCHLADLINQDCSVIADVKDQLEILHGSLVFSLFCIRDIGGVRISAIGGLQESVMRMGGVACEAEYLINSFLVGDAPLLYYTIRLSHVIDRIELIISALREIKKMYAVEAFDHVAKSFSVQPSLQAKPMSEVEVDSIIVGFADKEQDILDLVARGTNHLQIVSIFGMPGLGKTTLAKKVYNHSLIQYRFDRSVWCVVSQTYHRSSLLIDILDKLTNKQGGEDRTLYSKSEESFDVQIYKILKGRRYLFVLDDIWSTNVWDDLRKCFPDDDNGSRIVFTSRNKDVSPPNSITYALDSLSNEQCWELLEKKVFHNLPCPSQLIQIGKEIAANCYGLPLAVVVIAGILSTMDKEKSTWTKVGENLASFIYSDQNNFVMQILGLSYEQLPDHLKPCFLYFGVQQSTEISVRELMRLWIAEGFIHKEGGKNLENVAEEYLRDLIDKSLVMVSKTRSDGGVKTCVVHDLQRDMCLKRCREENFFKLHDQSIYVKGHRVLLLTRNLLNTFGQHLRSVHCYYPSESPFYAINMKLLRVLNFLSRTEPPCLIGAELLVQLRYLVVKDFPAFIGSLVNLEFLIVRQSTVIPSVMMKMKRLRYVKFMKLASFKEDCNSSETNNLEFVYNIHIMSLKDEEMLKCSPHLRTLKCTCRPILVEQGLYRFPDYSFLTHLESLNITSANLYMWMCEISEISEIKLPMNIKKLTLSGLNLPWEKMSIIGTLPKLEALKLKSEAFVGKTWETRDGEFEQLIFLKLDTYHLVQWNVASSQHFPKLQKLVLQNCLHLQEIPRQVGEVVALQSIELIRCGPLVEESALSIQEEQREMGNEELRVIMRK